MKPTLTFIVFVLFSFVITAQTNRTEKEFEKVNALIEKNDIEKAEEKLQELLIEDPSFGNGWVLLAKIHYYQYENTSSNDLSIGNISITTTDENGNEVSGGTDSLAQNLLSLLAKTDVKKIAFDKYIHTLRKSTLLSNDAYDNSIHLRNEFVVFSVDTMVDSKALKHYRKAEEKFQERNYKEAVDYYSKALEYQPDFFKAKLYMADAYYFMQNYVDAIANFKECSEMYPSLLEPRVYLVDAYYKEGLYKEALDAAIEGLLVYPGQNVFAKFESALYANNKKLNIEWLQRQIFPNKIESDEINFNLYKDPNELMPDEDWAHYKEAMQNIQPFCNENGVVIKTNTLTDAKYLEVFSWINMLENTAENKFVDARRVKSLGYLDCYVLISCFHQDIYPQYIHFVRNNPEKARKYFELIIQSN